MLVKQLLPLAGLLDLGLAAPSFSRRAAPIDDFIATQRPKSLQGILDNVGPDGQFAQGASAGVIIASPSTVNPNYLYTWTRDASLTIRTVIDEFILGNSDLKQYIDDFVNSQALIQTLNNPSGSFYTGAGLGEPKYVIDIKRFNGNWGRPQRDGPALRAIALMEYVNWLLENGEESQAKDIVWPVIANDLAYVGQYWNQTGFDLWEEVKGASFFTTQNQYRALVQGENISKELGLECAACTNEAANVLCFLQSFWNGETIVANTQIDATRNGADANNLLGPISVFDIEATCDSPSIQPCNSKILASHKVLVDSFRTMYGVNADRQDPGQAAAVGRYSEDVYYTGNPWYLTTLAAAEVLYAARAQWEKAGVIKVDSISKAFFADLIADIEEGEYQKDAYPTGSASYSSIYDAVSSYADGFVEVVQSYTPQNGSFSEQFGRDDGLPLSAYDLTWSYASFVTMSQRRAGEFPPSWHDPAAQVPDTCVSSSTPGTYVPATGAGAPDEPVSCTVAALFQVNASTYYGENIFLVGNTPDTGAWDVNNGIPLDASNYTSDRPLWYARVDLAADEEASYVYARQQSDGTTFLYEDRNRTLTGTPCNGTVPTIDDAWSGPTGTPPP